MSECLRESHEGHSKNTFHTKGFYFDKLKSAFSGHKDNPRSNQPERRTVLVTLDLARYKVEIAALSETRFSEQGQLEGVDADYTFFRSGRPRAERRDACARFALRNDIV
nr:unnamed protein product [Spirometra erinaceieuropaei]